MVKLAERMSRLGTETAFEVLAKAKSLEARGVEVIHLEIGEPDFDTPQNIIDAAVKALNQGKTHYGPAAGVPELRTVLADLGWGMSRYLISQRRHMPSISLCWAMPIRRPLRPVILPSPPTNWTLFSLKNSLSSDLFTTPKTRGFTSRGFGKAAKV